MANDADNLAFPASEQSRPNAGPRRFRYSETVESDHAVGVMGIPPGVAQLDWNRLLYALSFAALFLTWLFWRDFNLLAGRWISDSGWSHGFVVPLISVFFIRIKWDTLTRLVP